VHPHAEHAAEAAAASAAHRKFWEMHDILYAHPDALDDRYLAAYGVSLGIASTEIIKALTAQTYMDRIHEDFLNGVRSGVSGTPTFFINGKRHNGPFDFNSRVAAITAAAG
jgi:protein-disulfide isomerase